MRDRSTGNGKVVVNRCMSLDGFTAGPASGRLASTTAKAWPAEFPLLSRPPDRCRVLPWKITVKVSAPQRSEDVRP